MTQTYEAAEANRTADEPTLAHRQYRRYSALLTCLLPALERRRSWWLTCNGAGNHASYKRLWRTVARVSDRCDAWFDRWQAEQDAQQAAAEQGASRLLEVAA